MKRSRQGLLISTGLVALLLLWLFQRPKIGQQKSGHWFVEPKQMTAERKRRGTGAGDVGGWRWAWVRYWALCL